MSKVEDIRVPDIGDFENVPVIEIAVSPGDSVIAEDPLVTLESDKATMDVPSPAAGVVKEMKVSVGDTVQWQKPVTAFTHNVFSCTAAQAGCGGTSSTESFSSGPVTTGSFVFSHAFSVAGSNPYLCQSHRLTPVRRRSALCVYGMVLRRFRVAGIGGAAVCVLSPADQSEGGGDEVLPCAGLSV